MSSPRRSNFAGILVVFGCLAALPPSVRAETGLREACRQDLSSRYLLAYTDGQQSANEIVMLERQIKTAAPALEKADKEFQQAKADADREHFNQDKADTLQTASEKLRAMAQSMEETKRILVKLKTEHTKALAQTTALRERLSKVFVVQEVTLKGGAGQSVRLEYKSSCPKYRSTCPLPQQEAWDLESIIEKTPEACLKYSKVRGPRPTNTPGSP